ncbi:hypothetical protein BDQ17DRAFT_1430072 [Cyathus striatus]|nr:hypothetical protein BDQ17DRAFT_1430072 [Cyathus striatus]
MSFLPSKTLQVAVISLEHMQIINYVRVATVAIVVYDYLLTFDLEVHFVWKRDWSVIKILFILTRYSIFFDAITGLALQFLPYASAAKCKTLYSTLAFLSIGLLIAEAVLTLRTWAVCGGQKRLGIVLAIFYMGIFSGHTALACFFSLVTVQFDLQDTLDTILQGCLVTGGSYSLLIIDWSLILAYDTVNLVLIMTPAYQSFRPGRYSNLAWVVLRDGAIYYVYLFVTTIANIIIVAKLNKDYFIVMLILWREFHSILACRVVLHAREEGSKAYRSSISAPLTIIRFT